MSDVVGSAAVTIESDASQLAASIAAELNSEVTPALDGVLAALGQIEAGFADIGGQIAALEPPELIAESNLEAVSADVESVADALASVDGEEVTVDIEVDSSQVDEAEASIKDLGETSSSVAQGLGEATTSAGSFEGALAGITARVPVAGAGLAAITAGGFALANSAAEAEGALQSFELRTGSFGDEIRAVDIGALNSDLGDLAIQLGSDDEAALGAAARIFAFGEAAGASGDEAANTAQQISLLAARAVALNPALGDVGTATDRLLNALRTGRGLADFSVSLSTAEIAARALADTGKETAAELTAYDRAAAGAAIASEQLGDTLGSDILAGSENTIISLRSLQAQLGEAFETAGQPAVVPLLDVLESALPSITSLLELVGGTFAALAPVFEAVFTVAEPVLDLFAEGLPLAIGAVVDTVEELAGALDTVLGPLDEALGDAFGALSAGGKIELDVAQATEAATAQLGGQAAELYDVGEAVRATNSEFAEYLATQSLFAQDDELLKNLEAVGLPIEDLREMLARGSDGFREFVAAAVEAGQTSIEIDGVEQSAEDIANLDANLYDLLNSGEAVITSTSGVTRGFAELQSATEEAASSQIDYLVFSEQITQAQRDAAVELANASDGVGSYQEALDLLATDLHAVNVEVAANAEETGTAAEETELWTNILTGLSSVAADTAISMAFLDDETAKAIDALNGLGTNTVAAAEAATQALEDLNEDGTISLYEFTQSVETELANQAAFIANIRDLQERGFTDLALSLFEAGDQAAGAAAEAAAASDEYLATLEAQVDGQALAGEMLVEQARNTRADLVAEADSTQDEIEAALRSTDLAGALDDPILLAKIKMRQGGDEIGSAIAPGLADGIARTKVEAKKQMQELAEEMAETFRNVLDIFSPSRVFEDLGSQITAGLVAGIDGSASDASEATSRLAGVAVGGAETSAVAPSGATVTVGAIQVVMPAGATRDDGMAFGQGIGEGFIRQVESEIGVG